MYVCSIYYSPFYGFEGSVPFTLFTISLTTIPYANLDFNASLPYFLNLPLVFMLLQITQHYFSLFLFIQFWLSPTSSFSLPFSLFQILYPLFPLSTTIQNPFNFLPHTLSLLFNPCTPHQHMLPRFSFIPTLPYTISFLPSSNIYTHSCLLPF